MGGGPSPVKRITVPDLQKREKEIVMQSQTTAHFGRRASYTVLAAISFSHLLNDMLQSLLPAMYPIFKTGLSLSFSQLGFLTLTYQFTASMLQPLVGAYIDYRPNPRVLVVGMIHSVAGLIILASSSNYVSLLIGAAILGIGSAIFHPESSRLARLASGGAYGLAQSLFQVGGNIGSSLGPLCVAFFLLPRGQGSLAWFSLVGLVAISIFLAVANWNIRTANHGPTSHLSSVASQAMSQGEVFRALAILVCLLVSKGFYVATFTSYYIFYLTEKFEISGAHAQLCLFVFLVSVAAGTIIGGPLGDRVGTKPIIWGSIIGVLPFSLPLPYAGLYATVGLSIVIGLVLASSFSAIVVYAQELLPNRIGTVSGLIFGLAFGVAGLGAVLIGILADATSMTFVYQLCAFLPATGFLAVFLPNLRKAGSVL
jgi:FSR family fosmidomycin resistance protein-like MFS transporter